MIESSLYTPSSQNRWSYLWLLIGAGLLLFSNGRWMIPLATWLAPVFLIRFARTQPAFKGLGLLLVTNVLASLFFWRGIIPGGLDNTGWRREVALSQRAVSTGRRHRRWRRSYPK